MYILQLLMDLELPFLNTFKDKHISIFKYNIKNINIFNIKNIINLKLTCIYEQLI